MYIHILDGIVPIGSWFRAVAPLARLVAWSRSDVPDVINGVPVSKPAHVSDFYRMKVMSTIGGVYLDFDAVVLRPWDDLLKPGISLVVGRQSNDQIAIGVFAAKPGELMSTLLKEMHQRFNGGWTAHSVDMFSAVLPGRPEVTILPHDTLVPFSWERNDVNDLLYGKGFDWSGTYALHLYHSLSEGMTRYYSEKDLQGDGNLARGIRIALGSKGAEVFAKMLSEFEYYSGNTENDMKRNRAEQLARQSQR
eukprot:m.215485 g.215485  ORF g.215485 m.215485 type:complete len:250 (+) comp22205_c0_seq1:749-1498(+)